MSRYNRVGNDSLVEAGLLIHALGDSYAHTSGQFKATDEVAYGPLVGHLFAGHHPDEIAQQDVFPKYQEYVWDLFNALRTTERPDGEEKLKSYLCSLQQGYACKGERCDEHSVQQMEAAIGEWSHYMGRLNTNILVMYLSGPRLPSARVQQVMDEIKRALR